MKKLLLCAGMMISSVSFAQDSIIDMYKNQLDAIAAQLAEGDSQDLETVALAAKMVLQVALDRFAETVAAANGVIDTLAQSENKELVVANTQALIQGLSSYFEALQKAMNAGVLMGVALQGLSAEYQAQKADVDATFEDIVLD